MSKITIYTKPGCMQCKAAERFILKEGFEVEMIDVTQSEEAYKRVTEDYKSRSVPVIVKGDSWRHGFDMVKIRELLAS